MVAAGLVEIKVVTCLGAVLVCLACVGIRLSWVLGEDTAPVEKPLGPSAVCKVCPIERRIRCVKVYLVV